jgi:hypothetical protein
MGSTGTGMLPLRAPDRVVLLVDELPAVAATVVATSSAQATLLLDHAALPARMLHRRRGAVERTIDGRRFRGEGDLAMTEGRLGRVRDDTVVFHFRAPSRRELTRTPAILPVTLIPLDTPLRTSRALTIDVSPGGALVRSAVPLERGSELQVHLQLPTEELPIPAAGAVVRRTPEGLLGVRLDRMRAADRELVEAWLRDRR